MNDKVKRIQSERLIEATKKGLTGLEGKFGTILKYLGHPIISESGSYYESNYMPDDLCETEEENEDLPVMDVEQNIMELGYIFDGLSSGIHIEIKYILEKQELIVHFQGSMVYAEIASELICYVPSPDWETKIDYLFKHAKIRENKNKIKIAEENKQKSQTQKQSLLETLKTCWGI